MTRAALGPAATALCAWLLASGAHAQDGMLPFHVIRTTVLSLGGGWVSVRVVDHDGAIVVDAELGPYESGRSDPVDARLPGPGRYRLELEVGTRDVVGRVHAYDVDVPRDAVAVDLRVIAAGSPDPWLVGADLSIRRTTPLDAAAIELEGGSVAVRNDGRVPLVIPQRFSNVRLDAVRLDGTWVDLGRVGAGMADHCDSCWLRSGPREIAPGATEHTSAVSYAAPPLDDEVGPFRLRLLVASMRSAGTSIDAENAGRRPVLRWMDVHEVTRVLDDVSLAAWLDPPPVPRPVPPEWVGLALGRDDLDAAIDALARVPNEDVIPSLRDAVTTYGRERIAVLLDVGACGEARGIFATLSSADLAHGLRRLFRDDCPLPE